MIAKEHGITLAECETYVKTHTRGKSEEVNAIHGSIRK